MALILFFTGNGAVSESFQVDESTIAIGCWKGRTNLTVMVTAIDCRELLERLSVRIDTQNGSSPVHDDQPSINNTHDEAQATNGVDDSEATES